MESIEKVVLSMIERSEIINACVGVRYDNEVKDCPKVKLDNHWYIIPEYIMNKLKEYSLLSGDLCEHCFDKSV